MSGYDSLIMSVKKDCEKESGCFNIDGCIKKGGCFHEYCDKFKWILDRAKHYEKITGIDWHKILDSWEKDRNYWYMNYYQDCNQPLLTGKRIRVFENIEDFLKSIGEKGFRCPCCGGVTFNYLECKSGKEMAKGKICDWKVYGLLGDLGKGVYVFIKSKVIGQTIFMPIAWEKEGE